MDYGDIIHFWFDELNPKDWFRQSEDLDHRITAQFGAVLAAAACCELSHWRSSPDGRLAEVLVLDQFSRNVYRNSPRAFSQDPLALALAQEAIAANVPSQLSVVKRQFLYMPFMHSESPQIHQVAEMLFSEPGLEDSLRFERHHKAIIERFGRYPHRNTLLGRQSTDEERHFLTTPGSRF